MKKLVLSCFIILTITATASFAQQKSRIELNDGSVIEGEVSSLLNGTYTVNSNSLGQIQIEASKVRKINTLGTTNQLSTGSPETSNGPSKEEIESIKAKMLSNPQALKDAAELTKDPQFQELLKDPAILEAAKAGDIEKLISNEKIKGFSGNQKVKEITDKMNQ